MLDRFKTRWRKILTPLATALVKSRISADLVTWVGAVLGSVVAIVGFSFGWLWQTALVLGVLVISDSIDGQMARISGQTSIWGAFLDSTLDRISDGAIFIGAILWYVGQGDNPIWAGIAAAALVLGQVTSYTKARGEAVGVSVEGGLITRADRLLIVLFGALLTGFGVSLAWPIALSLLTLGGAFTVAQRMVIVYRQAKKLDQSHADNSQRQTGTDRQQQAGPSVEN